MTSGGSNFNDFPECQLTKVRAVETVLRIYDFLEGVSLGTRASEAASIDGVWAYGRNFSVSKIGRGHVIGNVHKWILSQFFTG